jgi:tetratricopeptide (TPR) repeat protein
MWGGSMKSGQSLPHPSDKGRSRGKRIVLRAVGSSSIYEFVFPPCVKERTEDIQEVYKMLQAGETEVAQAELLWLLEDCPELLEAHQLLGEIALSEGDLAKARAHFGRAFELGLKAIPREGIRGRLAADRPVNAPFFYAGRGLAITLHRLGQQKLAQEVVYRLLDLDPSDPLKLRELLQAE